MTRRLRLLVVLLVLTTFCVVRPPAAQAATECFPFLYLAFVADSETGTGRSAADDVDADIPLSMLGTEAYADFNGDGCADLAVGAPGESVGDIGDAGAVTVIFGSRQGLVAAGNQSWTQDGGFNADGDALGDINGVVEAGDQFGAALAVGDFNRDGYSDMAIGVPGDEIGNQDAAGSVAVLYGSTTGLVAAGNQNWTQDGGVDDAGESLGDLNGAAEASDRFGRTLAAGDFDRDGFADLAIGVPGEDLGAVDNGGSVVVLYGSVSGLTANGNQGWGQDGGFDAAGEPLGDLADAAGTGDRFGAALAAGDLNRDGYSDLVVGVPGEGIGTAEAGAIAVVYGAEAGLAASNNQSWSQAGGFDGSGEFLGDLSGAAEANDHFGATLAVGDFNRDGYADVAAGIPDEALGEVEEAGSAAIIYGAKAGLSAAGNQTWSQDGGLDEAGESLGDLNGLAEAGDNVGSSLAVGDFDRDGYADLAVGVPGEDIGAVERAGFVTVIYGARNGLAAPNNQGWGQNGGVDADGEALGNINGTAEANDEFGQALTTGDFNGDGYLDVAIGVPGERINAAMAGSASVIYGSTAGLAAVGNQAWSQNGGFDVDDNPLGDLRGSAEANDRFGAALTALR